MIFVVVSVLALIALCDLLRHRRPQPLAPAADGAVRHRAERGRVAPAPRRGRGDARRHRRSARSAVSAGGSGSRRDVELGGFSLSPLAIAGWTIVGGIVASLVGAIVFQSLWGLLVGLAAPFVTRFIVSRKVSKMRKAFEEQLADNLDVLAGAMRTGHSTMGALSA